MENGYLVTNGENQNQMQSYTSDKSSGDSSGKTEISHIDIGADKDTRENHKLGNGLVLGHEDVDGCGGNKTFNKVVDSEPLRAELAFVNPKTRDLTSDLTSELKLSVQTLESSNHSYECHAKSGAKHESAYNKRRNRLIVRAVVLLCLAGALQGILVNGLINVVISSIEKRFGIHSTETGFIANSYDIASFLCLLPVSYLGGRGSGSKPVWIGAGLVIMGLGSLLFSLPHFASTSQYRADGGDLTLCNVTRDCQEEQQEMSENSYKFVFMASQFLHGAGAAPLYTLGVTYIDENIGAASSAFYLGIFYTMGIVGPAIGYSVGGQLLRIHEDFLDDMSGDDPAWVGAWWLGFVICGVSALLIAGPIAMLPASLPGMKEPSSDQVCKSRVNSRNSSFRSSVKSRHKTEVDLTAGTGPLPAGKELLSAIIILVTNPTFIFVSLAGASEGFLMQGLATFLPKLIQNQFSLTASQAAVNVGAVSVVAGGGGTLLGGLAVKKLGLKVTGLLKMASSTQLLAIVMAIGLIVGCPAAKDIRLVDYLPDSSTQCDCQCDRLDYQPVCGGQQGDLQFFNPCYAGCQDKEPGPEGKYLNCTCVLDQPQSSRYNQSEIIWSAENSFATPGPCPTGCVFLPVFLASFFMTMLITFMANMPTLTATLRCVDPSVRSLALGIQWLLIRLLGTIPGPVAMGRLFDNACDTWQKGCDGSNQHCIIYDNDRISGNMLTLTAVCKGLSIAAFLIGIRLYKLPEDAKPAIAQGDGDGDGHGEGHGDGDAKDSS
eukprot:GFUD01008452.1.p1 GENE.GFUD01008452.1~~GFUD01008452.1.p1  ORF type:complete len:773 (-),score=179.75 GFUD01008452.1:95-2413(-)